MKSVELCDVNICVNLARPQHSDRQSNILDVSVLVFLDKINI